MARLHVSRTPSPPRPPTPETVVSLLNHLADDLSDVPAWLEQLGVACEEAVEKELEEGGTEGSDINHSDGGLSAHLAQLTHIDRLDDYLRANIFPSAAAKGAHHARPRLVELQQDHWLRPHQILAYFGRDILDYRDFLSALVLLRGYGSFEQQFPLVRQFRDQRRAAARRRKAQPRRWCTTDITKVLKQLDPNCNFSAKNLREKPAAALGLIAKRRTQTKKAVTLPSAHGQIGAGSQERAVTPTPGPSREGRETEPRAQQAEAGEEHEGTAARQTTLPRESDGLATGQRIPTPSGAEAGAARRRPDAEAAEQDDWSFEPLPDSPLLNHRPASSPVSTTQPTIELGRAAQTAEELLDASAPDAANLWSSPAGISSTRLSAQPSRHPQQSGPSPFAVNSSLTMDSPRIEKRRATSVPVELPQVKRAATVSSPLTRHFAQRPPNIGSISWLPRDHALHLARQLAEPASAMDPFFLYASLRFLNPHPKCWLVLYGTWDRANNSLTVEHGDNRVRNCIFGRYLLCLRLDHSGSTAIAFLRTWKKSLVTHGLENQDAFTLADAFTTQLRTTQSRIPQAKDCRFQNSLVPGNDPAASCLVTALGLLSEELAVDPDGPGVDPHFLRGALAKAFTALTHPDGSGDSAAIPAVPLPITDMGTAAQAAQELERARNNSTTNKTTLRFFRRLLRVSPAKTSKHDRLSSKVQSTQAAVSDLQAKLTNLSSSIPRGVRKQLDLALANAEATLARKELMMHSWRFRNAIALFCRCSKAKQAAETQRLETLRLALHKYLGGYLRALEEPMLAPARDEEDTDEEERDEESDEEMTDEDDENDGDYSGNEGHEGG
ncbi:hypothetical protein Tdes44962_MAKER09020 [Teratosphaeria destructans]|uniref:Uncharacterized protein n=1 Tax=Teratosphaeria destructans TaxID=418781 RepID=A0A9W7SUJ9_9PEZI|nr:hypothetical protein Tdes44962_MAKER09020 [Teratosphaeria destructans]